MRQYHVILFIAIGACILPQVLLLPVEILKNFNDKYDPNSIDQNEKILQLLHRLAYHTEHRIIRLKNEERIRADNAVDKNLKNITLKEIITENDGIIDIKNRLSFSDDLIYKNSSISINVTDESLTTTTTTKTTTTTSESLIKPLFRLFPNDENQQENNEEKIKIKVNDDKRNSSLEVEENKPLALKLIKDEIQIDNQDNEITKLILEMKLEEIANHLIDVLQRP